MIKAIVFDFDGTVVDSNEIKWGTYFHIFPSSDKAKKIISEIDRVNGTRWEIIRKILIALQQANEITFSDLEAEVKEKGQNYGEIVEKGIMESPGIPGAFDSLRQLKKRYPIYFDSGTPEGPFKETVDKLVRSGRLPGIKGVLGRKEGVKEEITAKVSNLERIKVSEAVSKDEIVFVGDREIDRKAAEEFGCHFIGVDSESSKWTKINFPRVKDLKNLPRLIGEIG